MFTALRRFRTCSTISPSIAPEAHLGCRSAVSNFGQSSEIFRKFSSRVCSRTVKPALMKFCKILDKQLREMGKPTISRFHLSVVPGAMSVIDLASSEHSRAEHHERERAITARRAKPEAEEHRETISAFLRRRESGGCTNGGIGAYGLCKANLTKRCTLDGLSLNTGYLPGIKHEALVGAKPNALLHCYNCTASLMTLPDEIRGSICKLPGPYKRGRLPVISAAMRQQLCVDMGK